MAFRGQYGTLDRRGDVAVKMLFLMFLLKGFCYQLIISILVRQYLISLHMRGDFRGPAAGQRRVCTVLRLQGQMCHFWLVRVCTLHTSHICLKFSVCVCVCVCVCLCVCLLWLASTLVQAGRKFGFPEFTLLTANMLCLNINTHS